MQNLYNEVASLDRRCYEQFELSEDILMEHAANGMAEYIFRNFSDKRRVVIFCGGGNNGADGIALARLLTGRYDLCIVLPFGAKSPMAKLQLKRAETLHVKIVERVEPCDILVDALFGSGFSRSFDKFSQELLESMNSIDAFKIACDIPSGVHLDGTLESSTFIADITLTMGALKRGMFSDSVKDVVGDIEVLDLGVSRLIYELESRWKLLEYDDLKLPFREIKNSHKGSFGHLSVICGEKEGAAILCASSALRFGAGLVTLVSNENIDIPYELMQSHLLPLNTTAIALGMGLGQEFSELELENFLNNKIPLVLDADIFSHPVFTSLLERENIIITPHPKEFVTLFSVCGLGDIDIKTLQDNRFKYAEIFSKAYPNVTLVLKGANVIIAKDESYFINPYGTAILAKGGSGDVLAGLIAALLAQGYGCLDAAVNGSLAHTKAASMLTCNNYAMSPNDLIDTLKIL